jgi:2-oxoglutarate ferredoxin oxidoreductase subunit alpha
MKSLIMGNEAVACGALRAGMTFFAAYPITPASEIMHVLAEQANDVVFVHAEDEIASIHMAIGGSLAGRKAMTSTSGPGFSLKQEGIGLAYMMEVPLVVVDVQRVGPSTGMPTLPSQGDILQAAHGSHGDYQALVFYPSSVDECYRYTIEAFNAAEDARSPVILLLDGFLGHLSETVDLDAVSVSPKIRSFAPLGQGRRHFTGLLAKDGAPRTKDSAYYREWYARVKAKVLKAAAGYRFCEFIRNERADTLLVAFGITHRVVLPLRGEYSLFKPVRLFPVLEEELRSAAEGHRRVVVVEMNDGQYRGEVEKALGRQVLGVSCLGGTISLNEVRERLHDL